MITELPLIIAEVKPVSPFGHKSDRSWDQLFVIANRVGDMISIHTDERWGGSMDLIRQARDKTDLPILAKGIHADDKLVEQAFAAGARWVLVVGRPDCAVDPQRTLYEPYTLEELERIPPMARTVWNARDLQNKGKPKSQTFDDARKVRSGWMCQASFIRTVEDIHPGAQAVLVGSELEVFAQSVKAFKEGIAPQDVPGSRSGI